MLLQLGERGPTRCGTTAQHHVATHALEASAFCLPRRLASTELERRLPSGSAAACVLDVAAAVVAALALAALEPTMGVRLARLRGS
eukprot:CAMPEP_0198548214 /NCGR_PEP_ID=MMETSP1462-20131121/69433_1 /TAXON_ID=1333877 /ORGANISM="Brandtodinium nutriculum, Strain RCC3387" /LENGTH=85 /DNA_ID=CAMNT_0044278733 /DNA_START=116 /DNA_END=370 /DNA_ORIENTATION=+